MPTAVDFAARFIDPAAIRAAGHSAVLVYVSPSRPGANFGAKPVTRDYADRLRAAGLEVVSIWQYGKPGNPQAPSDWTTGVDGGRRMAQQAAQIHAAAGGPEGCPIFFAVDEDISLQQWNTGAVHFFRGVNEAIGRQRTGVYGSSLVCAWAIEDDVVGRSTTPGKRWAWQTRAWSGNRLDTPEAVLYQRVIDTPSDPGPLIDGTSVDVDDILAADYGQWSLDREGQTVPPPRYTELDRMGNSRSSRWGARITNFLLHTQEGNGTAESLAAYLNNPANGVSYHYTLRDAIVCDVVDTDYASWSVLDANSHTINLCFAGSRAAWSREQWLAVDGDLRIAAWLAVQDARKYGFATDVIAPPYTRRDGISDHKYVTQALGIGTHTDVGPHFPWDVFARHVRDFADGTVPPPPPGAIDVKEAETPWLGARLTPQEQRTADGVGRFVRYENGYIYWHPSTGAHPIPTSLFGKYAELGWEAGQLGYPINDHTALRDPAGRVWGEVQGFQYGALYHRNGRPVHHLHGEIRERWNRSGFENGPLGWATSDEIPFDTGAYQEFEHGRVYWTPQQTLAMRRVGEIDEPLTDPR